MIYAVSDIHGYIDKFNEVMGMVNLSGNNQVVFAGDYMDLGKSSGEVLRYIYDLQKKYGEKKVIVLKGNHEAAFLEWINEFSGKRRGSSFLYDSWLRNDAELGYKTFKSLVSKEQFKELKIIEKKASFDEINRTAVKMIKESFPELISWLKNLPCFYETETQIFVHAGVDEEAEDLWKWGTSEDVFMGKYPPTTGYFYKTIIAGHTRSATVAKDSEFNDIFFDGESHYFIDGAVYKTGNILLLGYDEKKNKYYQIEKDGKREIKPYSKKRK